MRELLRQSDSARVGHLKSVLEQEGVPCFVKNEDVTASPALMDIIPSLWVINDEDYERAYEMIAEYLKEAPEA